jgi:putative peptidoglycan lipid II flippase
LSLFRNTLIVTVLNILGLFLSFFVSVIITGKFGASYYMDCYNASITIPNYISVVLGGALSYTFIPYIIKKNNNNNNNNQWALVNNIISIFIVSILFITILGICFAPNIMKIIAPGFKENQIKYSSELLILYFPIILFSCINDLVASIFYSKNIYFTPLLNKLISPIITITFIFLFSSNSNVKSLIYASVFAAFIQLIFLLIILIKKENFFFKFRINLKDQDVVELLKIMIPLILSSLICKFFPIIDSIILSKLPIGNISRINYANKLQLVIGSLLNSIFSIQVFSLLSKYAANKEYDKIKNKISFFIRTMLFISIPIAILFLFFGENFIRLLLERENFKSTDTILVSEYFKIYILALPAISIGAIVSQGLYVIPDSKSVMLIGFFETAFYLLICILIFKFFEAHTLPIAYVINFNLSVLVLIYILRKRLNLGGGIGILKSCLKIIMLSITIGVIVFIIVKFTNPSDMMILFYSAFAIISYAIIAKFLKYQEVTIIYEKIYEFTNKIKKLY